MFFARERMGVNKNCGDISKAERCIECKEEAQIRKKSQRSGFFTKKEEQRSERQLFCARKNGSKQRLHKRRESRTVY